MIVNRWIIPIAVVTLAAHRAGASDPVVAGSAPGQAFAGNACVECHEDLPGRSSEIVHLEWGNSVHFGAGVACDGCHGGNAQARPEHYPNMDAWKRASHAARDSEFLMLHTEQSAFVSTARGRNVSYFCGKCHAVIKESHLGSPHGEFGDPTCLYCHGGGSHRIESPSPNIIDTRGRMQGGRCSPCHLASTMETVARIKETLVKTEEKIRTSGELYAELEKWGYRSLELENLHHHAREVRSRLRQVFHSFNMREINNFVGEISLAVDRTDATYALVEGLKRAQRRQALIGGLVAAMLLVFAGLLVYYKNTFLHGDAGDTGP